MPRSDLGAQRIARTPPRGEPRTTHPPPLPALCHFATLPLRHSLSPTIPPSMKVHEYQARELLRSAGIPVPPGRVIDTIDQAAAAYNDAVRGMASPLAVVKAQAHAGGRGKAGFVKLVKSEPEAVAAARFMLTNRMKSPQTPPEGLEVKKLLIGQAADIAKRPRAGDRNEGFCLAIPPARRTRRNILIASREGGVEIEQIAHDRPD